MNCCKRPVQHRPAPDDRGLRVLEQKTDRHELDAEALERLDRLAVERDGRPQHASIVGIDGP
jgi:hypothetical protein